MGNKKDIGKLLNEQLSNFRKSPHDRVWDNIKTELKKSKRRSPFWLLFLGGGLLILSTATILIYNNYSSIKNEQLDTDTVNGKSVDKKTIDFNLEQKANELLKSQKDSIANSSLVSTDTETNTEADADADTLLNKTQKKEGVKSTGKTSNNSSKNNNALSSSFNPEQNKNKDDISNRENIIRNDSNNSNSILFLEGYPVVFIKTNFDFDIQFQENVIIPIKIDKPKKAKPVEISNDIILKAYIEPNYFNSLEKGSSIDEDLISNEKTTVISISYGAAIVYEFSPRSRISLGIARSNLSYITKNADSTNSSGQLIRSNGFHSLKINSNPEEISASLGASSTIDLKQNISLWEVPIEYSYKLIDRKLSLKSYGGVSFISHKEDSIIAESSNGNSLTIGNATNVGKISASLNFGVGLGYDVSDKIELFAEPTFKYYLNIFNQSDNFKPYSLSVRVGLLYKFN
jgi:hypothetical protein